MSLRRRRPPQWLTLESNKAAASTIAITITRIAGAPTAAWRVVDGGQIYEYSGDALSHVVQAGPCEIECRIAPKWIAALSPLSCALSHAENLKRLVNCGYLDVRNNPQVDISISDLSGIDEIRSWTELSGDIADWQGTSITADGNTRISGNIGSLSSDVVYIYLSGCINVTGYELSRYAKITNVHLQDQSAVQSRVNAIILDIWQHRGSFTYAGGITCNLDRNNAAPSGNVSEPEEGSDWHLDGETWIPLTAGAMVFDLVNDVNSEGFNFWNITVT